MLEQYSITQTTPRALPLSPAASTRKTSAFVNGVFRRLKRERRRRKVGRAYDMALEIAQHVPRYSRILDAGCGSGYIAHHLTAMVEGDVTGIDLAPTAEAPIDYKRFNGLHFPVRESSFDVVLLCYVLHHAQKLKVVLAEVHRALDTGGMALVYEDMPDSWWDRLACAIHNRKWRNRTGPCTFRTSTEWRQIFSSEGFEVTSERDLSRWRNLAHPIKRRLFVITLNQDQSKPI